MITLQVLDPKLADDPTFTLGINLGARTALTVAITTGNISLTDQQYADHEPEILRAILTRRLKRVP